MGLDTSRYKKSAVVPLWNIRIDESKASRLISVKKINLHSHQEHVVFFLNQNMNSIDLKLLILSFWSIKTQGIGHSSAASSFDPNSQKVVRRNIFGSHDVLDFSFGLVCDGNGDQHAEKINFLGFWFGIRLKFIDSADFLTD